MSMRLFKGIVLKNARQRTRFLTLGVDLNVERHKERSAATRPPLSAGLP